ncbi:hypothetical protein [Dyadobacter sandarakinus]|uniref:Uncharacterized protein n=1 Tax=Dyadobacter sandarakinus TaxID=2747268 RepID=A0ABX7I647_9BACT|nr:hypothetical protein [Dyadobacter sandarakinus]QRR01012.1 hypothetical protein HWI92_08915 [Dyadobacter sandarakinus]
MEVIIFLKAIGNLLLTAILCLALLISCFFSMATYLVKRLGPGIAVRMPVLFRRKAQ